MAQFDSFSIAAALVALLLATGLGTAYGLRRQLTGLRWWATGFLLLALWLATSTLRPEMAGPWLRALSWTGLYGATVIIATGLFREGATSRDPLRPILCCGLLHATLTATLLFVNAPPHLWVLLGATPTMAFLAWFTTPLIRAGAWFYAVALQLGIVTLLVRALFHPAGAARLFAPPPPGLRGGLPPAGHPADMIVFNGPPPGPMPPVEYALAIALVTMAALLLLAGTLVLRELLSELDRMRHRSSTDAMSGLLNRLTFEETAADRLALPTSACLVLFDIDHFKRINDTAGHAAGDRVIACLGQLLKETTLLHASAGRIGGEEFAVLLSDCELATARLFAEAIRTGFAASAFGDGIDWTVTVSAGIARHRQGESLGTLSARADKALYAAKSAGRDRVMLAEEPPAPPRLGRAA